MKKILNNKLYNTQTAKTLGTWINGCPPNDVNFVVETLCLKRTGEYFIHGVGGPGSKYAHKHGRDHWTNGEKIVPLTYAEAASWAEQHLAANVFESLFGRHEDTSGKCVVIHISLPAPIFAKAKQAAQSSGLTMSAYIGSLIQ